METTDAFVGQECRACGETYPVDTVGRCPDCGAPLSALIEPSALTRETLADLDRDGLARFHRLLPFSDQHLVDLAAGGTPLLDLPGVAEDLGLGTLAVKDEGRNPTGASADRWAALTVTAARETNATDVALASPGNGAQAVAAAAARAGLPSHSFVPSRTPFLNKAMINVHGGEMTVVPGRYEDAAAAYEDARADEDAGGDEGANADGDARADGTGSADGDASANGTGSADGDASANGTGSAGGDASANGTGSADGDADWHPAGPFASAFPVEAAKTVAYELVLQRDWNVPDAVIAPVGHGTSVVGLAKGFRELHDLGLLDRVPRLFATQPAGCAPLVSSWDGAGESVTPVDGPDTVCGELEIPDPDGGEPALAALAETDGGAAAASDDEALEAATTMAGRGLSASVTGGVALAGLGRLVEGGVLGASDEVVLLDPLSGNKEADLLRSHLMREGI